MSGSDTEGMADLGCPYCGQAKTCRIHGYKTGDVSGSVEWVNARSVKPGQVGVLFADHVEGDDENGCGYIRLTHLMGAAVARTVDLGDGLHLDVDERGWAIGIEYLNGRVRALQALVRLLWLDRQPAGLGIFHAAAGANARARVEAGQLAFADGGAYADYVTRLAAHVGHRAAVDEAVHRTEQRLGASEDRRIAALTAERDEARAAVRRVQDAIKGGAVSAGSIALALCSIGDGVGPSLLDELAETRARATAAEAERDGLTETIRHLTAERDELLAHPFDVTQLPPDVDRVDYLRKRLTAAWNQLDRAGDWAMRLAADLVAMRDRAESAEHRHDQVRAERDAALTVVEAADAWLTALLSGTAEAHAEAMNSLEQAVWASRVKEQP